MVTELRQVLRDAVETPPEQNLDLSTVLAAGARRVKRRRAGRVTAVGVAVAAAVAGVVAVSMSQDHDRGSGPVVPAHPHPLHAPMTLRIKDARPVTPDVRATTRVLHRDPANELDYDRFDGLTTDGLVVRSRYTYKGDVSDFGLLDPGTGRTDWLPRPPWDVGEPRALDFSADRLLYLDNRTAFVDGILRFDRKTRTWDRADVAKPAGTDRFFGLQATVGPGDEVYLLNPAAGGPGQWWSVPAARGGAPTRVKELDGKAIAWHGADLATLDRTGRVVVTTGGRPRVLASARPPGCEPPTQGEPGLQIPTIAYAGARLIVNFFCTDQNHVVVFTADGRPELTVEQGQVRVAAAGTRWVLLSETTGRAANSAGIDRMMGLDLDNGRLLTIGTALHEETAEVAGDLVMWNTAGPSDSNTIYDVVYKAALLR
jgi:hypothetical protein